MEGGCGILGKGGRKEELTIVISYNHLIKKDYFFLASEG